MANIKRYGEGANNGIEAYKETEPYYYGIDNRPIKNLTENDEKINQELESLFFKRPVENPDGERKIFTLPNQEIVADNSLEVYLNGIKYRNENIRVLPGGRQFEIKNGDIVPLSIDSFEIKYRAYRPDPAKTNFDILSAKGESLNQTITQKMELNPPGTDPTLNFLTLNSYSFDNISVFVMDENNSPATIVETFTKTLDQDSNKIHFEGESSNATGDYYLSSQEIIFNFHDLSIQNNYYLYVIKNIEDV